MFEQHLARLFRKMCEFCIHLSSSQRKETGNRKVREVPEPSISPCAFCFLPLEHPLAAPQRLRESKLDGKRFDRVYRIRIYRALEAGGPDRPGCHAMRAGCRVPKRGRV